MDTRGAETRGDHAESCKHKALRHQGHHIPRHIVCLDFLVIYLLTGKVMTAAAFMIVSNIYTTVGYFLHERVWAGIKWGMELQKNN